MSEEQIQRLEDRLRQLREAAAARRPPDLQAKMDAFHQELQRAIAQRALGVGDIAPDFRLHRADTDEEVHLYAYLERGPVVLSFYRGQW